MGPASSQEYIWSYHIALLWTCISLSAREFLFWNRRFEFDGVMKNKRNKWGSEV